MNNKSRKTERITWEEFGRNTMLECNDEAKALEISQNHLRSFALEHKPKIDRLNDELKETCNRANSLHEELYARPIPVHDAAMLTHSHHVKIVLALAVLAALAGIGSNAAMFIYLDWGVLGALLAAIVITVLPLGLGHLFFEKVLAEHKIAQLVVIVLIAVFTGSAVYQFGQARRMVMDKATGQSVPQSYIEGGMSDDSITEPSPRQTDKERFTGTFGGAMFMASLASELALGFLLGLLVHMRTYRDYVAWCTLGRLAALAIDTRAALAELFAKIEMSEKQCLAGIRHAQSVTRKSPIPYHRALTAILVLLILFSAMQMQAQGKEGIVIDGSTSVSGEFQAYVRSTKRLLTSEPPDTHVWVSTIGIDSFGEAPEILSGWTPGVKGIFDDGLAQARRQLATTFEVKSASLAARASGTDIIGALWHLKMLFESSPKGKVDKTRTIWIFSDMKNESQEFPMPQLLQIGPERMLDRAKAGGLVVPLQNYRIFIYGTSPRGLTPEAWGRIKRFWQMYFAAAGADLVVYSPECNVARGEE
jgi:hypothetical protein